MSITVALICHDDPLTLWRKLWEISAWSRQPNELLILHNGIVLQSDVSTDIPITWIHCEDRKDKGYEKRAIALDRATGDYILWVNYDDSHDFHILEKLEPRSEDVVVHCCTTGKYGKKLGSEFRRYSSGAENFLVRVDYARGKGGYWSAIAQTDRNDPQADKWLIDALAAGTNKVRFVDETLVVQL